MMSRGSGVQLTTSTTPEPQPPREVPPRPSTTATSSSSGSQNGEPSTIASRNPGVQLTTSTAPAPQPPREVPPRPSTTATFSSSGAQNGEPSTIASRNPGVQLTTSTAPAPQPPREVPPRPSTTATFSSSGAQNGEPSTIASRNPGVQLNNSTAPELRTPLQIPPRPSTDFGLLESQNTGPLTSSKPQNTHHSPRLLRTTPEQHTSQAPPRPVRSTSALSGTVHGEASETTSIHLGVHSFSTITPQTPQTHSTNSPNPLLSFIAERNQASRATYGNSYSSEEDKEYSDSSDEEKEDVSTNFEGAYSHTLGVLPREANTIGRISTEPMSRDSFAVAQQNLIHQMQSNNNQNENDSVSFLSGPATPIRLLTAKDQRKFPFVGEQGDLQIRVRRHKPGTPGKVQLEVQVISIFRPYRFARRLIYLYSVFQLTVYLVVLTISFIHQVAAGVYQGDYHQILKIPLLFHFIHCISHILCVINRVLVDILSNFDYIQNLISPEHRPFIWCAEELNDAEENPAAKSKDYSWACQLIDDIFGVLLIGIPALVLSIFLICGESWKTAIRKSQIGAIVCAGIIVGVYLLEHIVTVWKFIRIFRRHDEEFIESKSVTKRCFSAIAAVVETRMVFTLSSIMSQKSGKGNEKYSEHTPNDEFDFQRFPRIIRKFYIDPRKDGATTVFQSLAIRTSTTPISRASTGWSKHKVFDIILRVTIVIAIVLVIIAVSKALGYRGATLVIVLIFVGYKLGNVALGFLRKNKTGTSSLVSHLIWIFVPVNTERESAGFITQHICGIFNCDKDVSLNGYERVWLAQPKKRFWQGLLLFSVLMYIIFSSISIAQENYLGGAWCGMFIGIGFVSYTFFFLDPEGWAFLKEENTLQRAGIADEIKDFTPTERHAFDMLTWIRKQRSIMSAVLFIAILYIGALHFIHSNFEEENEYVDKMQVEPMSAEEIALSMSPSGYCNVQAVWNASDPFSLELQDYAALAALSYVSRANSIKEMLTSWFENSTVTVELLQSEDLPPSCQKSNVVFQAYGARQESEERTILAIRGTTDYKDWFEDISVWGPVVLMEMASKVLPFGDTWDSSIPSLLRATSIFNGGAFADSLMNCIEDLQSYNSSWGQKPIILTGHSLGGGIAAILGARLDLPNVVFSAPGVELSVELVAEGKLENLQRNTVNVIPDGDIVPQVDRPTFHVQRISCDDTSALRPVRCHSIVQTVNKLAESCGGDRVLMDS